MVFCCVREEEEGGQSMAMGPERSSKPLHNFTLPCTLKWGNQRYLRCMKVQDSPSTDDHRSHRRRSSPASRLNGFSDDTRRRERVLIPSSSLKPRTDVGGGAAEMFNGQADEEEGIEAVREKIMNDLKTAADKMKDAIFREGTVSDYEEEEGEVTPVAAAAQDSVRPWNLRTRRAACKAPVDGTAAATGTATPPPASKGLLKIDERRSSPSPMRNEVGAKTPRMMRAEKERPKFSVSLTKKEIEEDFMVLFNHRPPRRPKKRPRAVQKQLDVTLTQTHFSFFSELTTQFFFIHFISFVPVCRLCFLDCG